MHEHLAAVAAAGGYVGYVTRMEASRPATPIMPALGLTRKASVK
jgi:hypothetical protein